VKIKLSLNHQPENDVPDRAYASSVSNDGTSLEFDLTITPSLETEGDIRIVYSGPIDLDIEQ
jgi:hypothetical protein